MSGRNVIQLEPWLDKRALANHLGCGIRWIEMRTAEGMPSAIIAGRRKFRASEVEEWLERAGHLRRDAA
jgi:hypothetical protein